MSVVKSKFSPFTRRICFCKFLEQVICRRSGTSDGGLDHLDRAAGGPDPGHEVLGLVRQVLVDLPVGAANVHHQLGLCVKLGVTRGALLLHQTVAKLAGKNRVSLY